MTDSQTRQGDGREGRTDAATLEAKLRKYEDIILQLKVDNQQLEDDLAASFERENDLQKALEAQKTLMARKEAETGRQNKFESLAEIERLNETVFKKNREISEKIIEISNLNFALSRQGEEAAQAKTEYQEDLLYVRHKIDQLKLNFQKALLGKSALESGVSQNIGRLELRLRNLVQRIRLITGERKAEKAEAGRQLEVLGRQLSESRRQQKSLEEKIEHMEAASGRFKEEIGQLKTIHGLAAINSQKELSALRFSMKEFLEKHKQRIKTMKVACEQFLSDVFDRFSVLESLKKLDEGGKVYFSTFFENLKRITSDKFSTNLRILAETKGGVTGSLAKTVKGGSEAKDRAKSLAKTATLLATPSVPSEKPAASCPPEECKSCMLLRAALGESDALLKEQQRFFESQKRILTTKKKVLVEEKTNLKRLMKVNDDQYREERQSLLGKLEGLQQKVVDLTAVNETLDRELMDWRSQASRLGSDVQRLTSTVSVLKAQKEETKSKLKDADEKSREETLLKQKVEQLTGERVRMAGYLQELRTESGLLKQNAKTDLEMITGLKDKVGVLTAQLNQKEETIDALKTKLERLETGLMCPKHQLAGGLTEFFRQSKKEDAHQSRTEPDGRSSVKLGRSVGCLGCLKDASEKQAQSKSELLQQQQSLRRKDEIIRSLQAKLEETERQTEAKHAEMEASKAQMTSKIKLLELENRKIDRAHLESTRDIEALRNCLSELTLERERSEAKMPPVNKHLAETCKLLDLDVDDLGLFLDPKQTLKSQKKSQGHFGVSSVQASRNSDVSSFVSKCRDKLKKSAS